MNGMRKELRIRRTECWRRDWKGRRKNLGPGWKGKTVKAGKRLALNREATEAETGRRAKWGMPGVNPGIETRDEFIGGRLHFPFLDEAREDLDSYLRRFERLASLQK